MRVWLQLSPDKKKLLMKKWGLVVVIGLIMIFCSSIVSLVAVSITCRDRTVVEQVIDDSYTARIRTIGCWMGYIPVYLEIENNDGKMLRSRRFMPYSEEAVKSKELELEIDKVDTIIFVYHREEPDEILVMASFEDNLVYPRLWKGENVETKKLYYAQVEELFSHLKELLEDEDAYLYGFVPPDK